MSTFEIPEQIEKLKARDIDFLGPFFEDMNPTLLRMLASRGIFAEHAEELIQQTWETFFANLEKFEAKSQVKTFLIGILINKIREGARHSARVELEDDSEKVFANRFTADGWWAKEPAGPEALMQNRQLGNLIDGCLKGLTPAQRSAFLLVESDGEESSTVCNILGVTSTHLRVLIFRAKEKLRLCLEGLSA